MKDLFVSTLYDIYGALLTQKQSAMINEYYNLDYSLGEIAENTKVSRQAVHFCIKQAADALYVYEKKLNLVKKMDELQKKISETVLSLESGGDGLSQIKEIENNLRSYYGTIQ